jgi:hypothetical protein
MSSNLPEAADYQTTAVRMRSAEALKQIEWSYVTSLRRISVRPVRVSKEEVS